MSKGILLVPAEFVLLTFVVFILDRLPLSELEALSILSHLEHLNLVGCSQLESEQLSRFLREVRVAEQAISGQQGVEQVSLCLFGCPIVLHTWVLSGINEGGGGGKGFAYHRAAFSILQHSAHWAQIIWISWKVVS